MKADERPVPSVWARPSRQREQPALSRRQIVSEAVRLLDAEGIDALSMRRLGARLGAGATSLYRHVAGKDELIELVVDEVYGELHVPDADDPAGWRDAVIGCADSLRSTVLRHPWIVSLLGEAGLSHLGPSMMRLSDRMLAIFEVAGFALDEAGQAMETVVAYVLGITTGEAAWLTTVARTGRGERELVERLWPVAEQAAEDYPRLRERYAAQRGKDLSKARDESFRYGLERILDGLQARLGGAEG